MPASKAGAAVIRKGHPVGRGLVARLWMRWPSLPRLPVADVDATLGPTPTSAVFYAALQSNNKRYGSILRLRLV
jgi:hypothetical protein